MRKTLAVAIAGFSLLASQLTADEASTRKLKDVNSLGPSQIVANDAASECTGGAIVDDGTYEDALRVPFITDARFVQLLTPTTYPSLVERVCTCWQSSTSLESMSYNLLVYDDNGAGGQPGTLLGTKQVSAVNLTAFAEERFGYDCSDLPISIASGSVYVGVQWNSAAEVHYFLCEDESATTPQASMYYSGSGGLVWSPVSSNNPEIHALGVRAKFAHITPPDDPEPPATGAITSANLPGYRVWVRISDSRIGTSVADCVGETICVAGAIPTRAEVFVRIVGPKSNGYLWPNVVKFNTTKTEVWIQQISSGDIQYYLLPALATDSDELPGLVDRMGFLP